MSRSHDIKGIPWKDLPGDPDPDFETAERRLAKALDVDPAGLATWEDPGGMVLAVDPSMLTKLEAVIAQRPGPEETVVLLYALREEVHRKPVHRLVKDLTEQALREWMDGKRGLNARRRIHELASFFRFGVQAEDYDLVARLCTEESFRYAPDGSISGEDLRAYWFDALAKIKDERVPRLCESILRDDLDQWTDYRTSRAFQTLGRFWREDYEPLVGRYATDHPDSWVRQAARRVLKKHS
jgi:hypothetical protein